jgi:predicted DNA-binding transcriptional regulator YafY
LLQLLLGRGRWDAKLLAAELECTERTIYRYLKVLEFAGVPYVYDKDQGCYRVRPDVKFPVLKMNRDEVLSQVTASTVAQAKGITVADAHAINDKLAASSGDEVAQLISDAQNMMTALDLKLADHSKHQEILQTVQWSLIEGKQLSVKYYSPHKNDTFDFKFNPYRLCLSGQAWYLIAANATKPESKPKTYRVMRIKTARMLDHPAVIPDDFDLGNYFGNAWNVFRGETTYDVEVEFTAEAAELVTETVWHQSQKVKRHKDGRVTLTFTIDGLDEIVWWVLSWSGRAKVVSPPELRSMVIEQLERALELNKND